jgi:acetyl-CoA C-acetyltransferase
MSDDRIPILVGCGDVTDATTPVEVGRSPFDLIAEAARRALADTGAGALAGAIDVIATVRLFADASHRFATKLGGSANPPKSIAQRLAIHPRRHIYSSSGGNMPQYLVNHFSQAIAEGDIRAVLLTGGEALRTQQGVERANLPISWSEDPGGQPEAVGIVRSPWSEEEERHHLRAAYIIYPLFENAIRRARGRTISEHMESMARLFARFADVAALNPLAIRRAGYSAERLVKIDRENRWIGFPYPRLMNAHPYVDQAAALILTSVGVARNLGIPPAKWVFLHGCADGNDHWYASERINLHSSPAIRMGARKALDMAGRTLADMRFLDLYSCFPSAVEIACQEMSVEEDDPRGLTVTGGLPYFGGPGNNYVTHSISEMMRQLRAHPGTFGMVTANGNYVTKHSFGIYSTTPWGGKWGREDPGLLQAELDALPKAPLIKNPSGPATIETYTIMHGKTGPEFGVLLGRLTATDERFIANTPSDRHTLDDLREREGLGRQGVVESQDGRNVFVPKDQKSALTDHHGRGPCG